MKDRPIMEIKEAINLFRSQIADTVPTIYATVIVCIYITFSYIKYTKNGFEPDQDIFDNALYENNFKKWNEMWFFIFLYGLGVFYLCYIALNSRKPLTSLLTREHPFQDIWDKKCSNFHVVHIGIFILAIGVLAHYIIEISIAVDNPSEGDDEQPRIEKIISVSLGILYALIQTHIIIKYPFLTTGTHITVQRFGTAHVVATNMVLWLQTLLEETKYSLCKFQSDFCPTKNNRKGTLPSVLMFVYPFVIEFLMVGTSLFLVILFQIGKDGEKEGKIDFDRRRSQSSRLQHMIKEHDCSNSLKGVFCGGVVLVVTITSLYFFHENQGLELDENKNLNSTVSNATELLTEDIFIATSLFNNIVGVLACIGGLIQIQHLNNEPWKRNLITNRSSFNLDCILLRFSSSFSIMYAVVTFITGLLTPGDKFVYTHGYLHCATGVFDIILIMLQVLFLVQLTQKVLPMELRKEKPGRQFAIFLFFLNISEWIVLTFEIQKWGVTPIEQQLFGATPGIILKRIILPFAIFFRFHSAWLSIELWQEIYSENESTITRELSNISEETTTSD